VFTDRRDGAEVSVVKWVLQGWGDDVDVGAVDRHRPASQLGMVRELLDGVDYAISDSGFGERFFKLLESRIPLGGAGIVT
jgi:hypothetical protein